MTLFEWSARGGRALGPIMSEITILLSAIERGDPSASERLLPLIYDELRALARARIARESPGHMLQATDLVHEAYLRLVGPEGEGLHWGGRGHFFAAAAEAMRRILVDHARRRQAAKRGGGLVRREFHEEEVTSPGNDVEVLAVDEALGRLASRDRTAAEVVKLRYFAGLTMKETALALGLSERTADRRWAYARAFLLKEMTAGDR